MYLQGPDKISEGFQELVSLFFIQLKEVWTLVYGRALSGSGPERPRCMRECLGHPETAPQPGTAHVLVLPCPKARQGSSCQGPRSQQEDPQQG